MSGWLRDRLIGKEFEEDDFISDALMSKCTKTKEELETLIKMYKKNGIAFGVAYNSSGEIVSVMRA